MSNNIIRSSFYFSWLFCSSWIPTSSWNLGMISPVIRYLFFYSSLGFQTKAFLLPNHHLRKVHR